MTQPFVKWAGGKRQLLPAILNRLPSQMATYFEPFVGGGAVLFALAREGCFDYAVVNDLNEELIQTYRTLSTRRVEEVISLLQTYPYDETFYYEMRARKPADLSEIEKAARFIYLNRTGFNGLYRVNKEGQFNVPFGKYTDPLICDDRNLRLVQEGLRTVSFECEDFESSVESARPGDVVYFDPPYIPMSDTSNFTEYTDKGFGIADQKRLAATFRRLAERGVRMLLSNADTPLAHELYAGFPIEIVEARRSINSKGEKRGSVREVLVSANLSPVPTD